MKVHIYQTHHQVGDFTAIAAYLEKIMDEAAPGIHLFPELFLCGYPLQDLCLQKGFIENYLSHLEQIDKLSKSIEAFSSKVLFLMGGLEYSWSSDQERKHAIPTTIKNVIYGLEPGKGLKKYYTKKLLPNYDIFDEKKYFTAGEEVGYLEWEGVGIGLSICEDIWTSTIHNIDPISDMAKMLAKQDKRCDLLVNLSASPFHIGKQEKRIERAKEIVGGISAGFAYVNRVGGEDEILFDGQSFFMKQVDGGKFSIKCLKAFQSDTAQFKIDSNVSDKINYQTNTDNTWEELFNPELDYQQSPVTLRRWTDLQCEKVIAALCFGISEYASKCGFDDLLVANSGGIDSALTLVLAKMALKESAKLEAIFMPGLYSSTLSYELSTNLCQNLGIKQINLPIKFFHSTARNQLNEYFGTPLEGLSDENIQSRLRGCFLYTRSNQTGAMVLNTSNKSEISVGYSTLYGDSVGAISVLGDLYKTEVFRLCEFINQKYNGIIPEEIITRPPTAELRENQRDDQSLPPYEILDAILEGFLSYRLGVSDLAQLGHDQEQIRKVIDLYQRSEYKRKQFPPIIKVKTKSFGFGYRIPICKASNIYI
ncbi:MAG: NAD(+) synthase [Bacteriovoracaceae bacterium]|nr:NAD(+) synthase [Bacteriovoracaceae bacterium]